MATKKSSRPSKPSVQSKAPTPRSVTEPFTFSVSFLYPGFWKAHRLQVLFLFALTIILYAGTFRYGYLQDDQLVTWGNIFVQKGFGGLLDIFGNDSLLGYYVEKKNLLEGGRYRPLPLMTFALEVGIFGKSNPGISHFVNVLLYAITSVFLYRILAALFPLKDESPKFFNLPFIATLLFILHPLHTEVVANVKGRDEILALLGSLGALYSMLKFYDTGTKKWLWFAGLSLFGGLLSKENTITFLAVIPLTIWMFSKIPLDRIITTSLVLLASTVLFLFVRMGVLGYIESNKPMDVMALNPFVGMTFLEKFATIFLTLGWYLKLFILPHPLTIDYYPYHVPKTSWADWRPILSLGLYVWMGIWAFQNIKKARQRTLQNESWRVPSYCISFYLLTISVVSNIFVSTSTFMNERYSYMPSIGFSLLLAWLVVQKLPEWLRTPQYWSAGLVTIIAVLFALGTWERVPDWGGDGSRLVESSLKVSPDSYRSNYYYGAMLYQQRYMPLSQKSDPKSLSDRKEVIDSINFYIDRSLSINPGYQLAGILKVSTAAAQYQSDNHLDKMLQEYEQLIKNQSYNGEMLTNMLKVLKSIKGVDPNVYNFFCHRVGYAFYFKQKGDLMGAAEFLNLAITNYPQDRNSLQDLLEVYTALGDQGKATEIQQKLNSL